MLDSIEELFIRAAASAHQKMAELEKEQLQLNDRQSEIKSMLLALEPSFERANSRIGYIPEIDGIPTCLNCFVEHGANTPLTEVASDESDVELFCCKKCGHTFENSP